MEPFSKRPRVEGPGAEAVKGEEAVTFHLLSKDPETGAMVLEENGHFPPEMTHQLFGEQEEVVGYDGLSIDIWLSPQFQTFIDVKYAGKGPGATDLRTPFRDAFPAGFFEQKADFDKALQEEPPLDLSVLGKEVASRPSEAGTTFRVYRSHLASADPQLKALHKRMEPLLLFFVDAAAAIDAADEGWQLFTIVEEPPKVPGALGPAVVGFATAYRFWHYPEGSRLRLAQILVLPPHQGRGAGALALEAVQGLADELNACDLAFEDPAEGLQSLRTFLDVKRALGLEWAQQAAVEHLAALAADRGKGAVTANGNGSAAGSSKAAARAAAAAHPLAAPPAVLERLRKELRLSRLQAGLVWRVLLLVVGRGEAAVAAGVESLVRQAILAQVAEAKGDAQGKSVRETDKGFVMCRGAGGAGAAAQGRIPLLPVEEQTAEQQAEAVEEAAQQQFEFVRGVAAKFLGGDDDEEEGGDEEEDDE
ncbi:hypothetical protein ABPG75_007636 [Micractinium tetrahymenae]